MIDDMLTVVWKDIREIIAIQGTIGGVFRLVFALGLLSIFFPLYLGLSFIDGPTFLFFYVFIPLLFGIVIVADSFAGERERHTLETLLASRLSDRAILFGKLLVSVLYCFTMTLMFIILSLVVVNAAYGKGQLLTFQPSLLVFVIVAALLIDTLFAAIGVLASLRAPTVRQGAEMLMVFIFALAGVPLALYLILPNDLKNSLMNWLSTTNAGVIGLVILAVLAVVCLFVLGLDVLNFRRNKLTLE